jgi:hypothetical protein
MPAAAREVPASHHLVRRGACIGGRQQTTENLDMHTGQAIPIRDPAGNVVGQIETMQNGDQVLRNNDNEVRGYYDATGDFTRDAQQNIVAKGNKLRSMIC